MSREKRIYGKIYEKYYIKYLGVILIPRYFI